MDFKGIPKKYCPIPFWSWNERLGANPFYVDALYKKVIGGFIDYE